MTYALVLTHFGSPALREAARPKDMRTTMVRIRAMGPWISTMPAANRPSTGGSRAPAGAPHHPPPPRRQRPIDGGVECAIRGVEGHTGLHRRGHQGYRYINHPGA